MKTVAVLVAALVGSVQATTFYFDSAAGSDANDGLTPATAWQTLAKANEVPAKPGDRVLFKRGGVWRGTLTPKSGEVRHGAEANVPAVGRPVASRGLVRGVARRVVHGEARRHHRQDHLARFPRLVGVLLPGQLQGHDRQGHGERRDLRARNVHEASRRVGFPQGAEAEFHPAVGTRAEEPAHVRRPEAAVARQQAVHDRSIS